MRAYLVYKDKSVKGFKHLINTGSGIFDKYRTLAVTFIRYTSTDLDTKLAEYDMELNLNGITLEQVFGNKYRWLVSDISFRTSRNYLKNIEERITEFEGGKEDNLKVLVGVLFLRFVIITKLVETYLGSLSAIKAAGGNIDNVKLSDIGISKQIMKYFAVLEDLGDKTIDDWLQMNIDPSAAKHFYSSMKRIMTILMSVDEQ